jgi:hypothetical protein
MITIRNTKEGNDNDERLAATKTQEMVTTMIQSNCKGIKKGDNHN